MKEGRGQTSGCVSGREGGAWEELLLALHMIRELQDIWTGQLLGRTQWFRLFRTLKPKKRGTCALEDLWVVSIRDPADRPLELLALPLSHGSCLQQLPSIVHICSLYCIY
jgi:hypothetical protein